MLGRRIIRRLTRPAALARTALFLLGAGVAANALFLQSGPHPAPLFAAEEPAESADLAEPDALVEALQSELKAAGYYEGPVDGLAGPETEAAIVTFERASGREATGAVRPELLEAIHAGAGAPGSAGDADGAEGDRRIAAVQAALSRAAYGPLPPDGLLGPRTRDAIRRFEADHGLPVTGEVSERLLAELHAAGALDQE